MKRLPVLAFVVWTLGGTLLLGSGAGSHGWWDFVWVLLLVIVAYAEMASVTGLHAARVGAGISVLGFSVFFLVAGATGWLLGPIRFTDHAGPRIAATLPVLVPVFAFALLAVCHRSAEFLRPALDRRGTALLAGGLLAATVANGASFLSRERLWWLWNPWGTELSAAWLGLPWIVLFGVSAGLALALQPSSRLQGRRLPAGWLALLAINVLFLLSHFKPTPSTT
ncbi:MAG: hypothetical protein SFU53_02675 [Terrimicrobiaceae bacterium]|nr:hypothetical protein [Terrimicrobiaceae bacterium]